MLIFFTTGLYLPSFLLVLNTEKNPTVKTSVYQNKFSFTESETLQKFGQFC